jgi:hypothetical protein
MADCVKTILNSNPARNGTAITLADKVGNVKKVYSGMPSGDPTPIETRYTDRLGSPENLLMASDYVTVAASGSEVSWSIPEGIEKFLFKCRTLDNITYGFNSGDASGVKKTTLFAGTAWETPNTARPIAGQTMYFTGASGLVVEINYWR